MSTLPRFGSTVAHLSSNTRLQATSPDMPTKVHALTLDIEDERKHEVGYISGGRNTREVHFVAQELANGDMTLGISTTSPKRPFDPNPVDLKDAKVFPQVLRLLQNAPLAPEAKGIFLTHLKVAKDKLGLRLPKPTGND